MPMTDAEDRKPMPKAESRRPKADAEGRRPMVLIKTSFPLGRWLASRCVGLACMTERERTAAALLGF
jgi:hypothetical protein